MQVLFEQSRCHLVRNVFVNFLKFISFVGSKCFNFKFCFHVGNSKTPPTYNQSHQSSNDAFDPKVENNFENPLELDEDSLSEVEMNPVVTMAMDQVKKDIESSSQQLGISSSKSLNFVYKLKKKIFNKFCLKFDQILLIGHAKMS